MEANGLINKISQWIGEGTKCYSVLGFRTQWINIKMLSRECCTYLLTINTHYPVYFVGASWSWDPFMLLKNYWRAQRAFVYVDLSINIYCNRNENEKLKKYLFILK